MKISCLAFSFFLLLLSTMVVQADSLPVDPKMVVKDPHCVDPNGCGTLVGSTFMFTGDPNGGGFKILQNASNTDWTSLLIETGSDPFTVPADTITCLTNAFENCTARNLAGGITAIYLSGTNEQFLGIPSEFQFTISLNDDGGNNPEGTGGWGANRTFTATANVSDPVPEPATLALMGIGISALAARKKLRGRGTAPQLVCFLIY